MAEGKWIGSSERLKSISEPSVPQCSWIKWKCFKILLTHLAFCLQIHPIIWEEIQQRRSRAFYQIVVWVGDDSQTGDQHDARICAPADKPVKVRADFCWLPKLLSQNSRSLLLLHVVVYFNVIVLLKSRVQTMLVRRSSHYANNFLYHLYHISSHKHLAPFRALGLASKLKECQVWFLQGKENISERHVLRLHLEVSHNLTVFVALSHASPGGLGRFCWCRSGFFLPGLPAACAKRWRWAELARCLGRSGAQCGHANASC